MSYFLSLQTTCRYIMTSVWSLTFEHGHYVKTMNNAMFMIDIQYMYMIFICLVLLSVIAAYIHVSWFMFLVFSKSVKEFSTEAKSDKT